MSAGFGIQDAVAVAGVLVAAAWLVRRSLRRRKRGACACDGCPAADAAAKAAAAEPAGGGLISIESPGRN